MKKADSPNEVFKTVLSVTTSAMTQTRDVEVSFGTDGGFVAGNRITLANPPRKLSAADMARVRGEADGLSLRVAHHDEKTFARSRPESEDARRMFDAAERARIESIGRARHGRRGRQPGKLPWNIVCERAGYLRMEDRQAIPMEDALEMVLRERLNGRPLPKAAEHVAGFWREEIQSRSDGALEEIEELLDDQRAFGDAVRKLIRNLKIGEEADLEENPDGSHDDEEDVPEEDGGENDPDETEDESQADTDSPDEQEQQDDQAGTEDDVSAAREAEAQVDAEHDGAELDESSQPLRPNFNPALDDPNFNYQPFTTEHDEVKQAEELCDPEELGRLRAYSRYAIVGFAGSLFHDWPIVCNGA